MSRLSDGEAIVYIITIIAILCVIWGYWFGSHTNRVYTSDTEYTKAYVVGLEYGIRRTYKVTVTTNDGSRTFGFSVSSATFEMLGINDEVEIVRINNEWRVLYP